MSIRLLLLLGQQFFLLFRARVSHVHTHIIHYGQEDPKEENAEKKFRFPEDEEKDYYRNTRCCNCIVMYKVNDCIHNL